VTVLTRFLRDYQLSVGFVPGPLVAAAFLAGLLGAAGVGRARRSGLQPACLLPTLVGLVLLLGAAVYEFSWRYQLPALVFAPLGGALGLTAMLRRSPPAGVGEEPSSAPPGDAAAPTESSPEPAGAR